MKTHLIKTVSVGNDFEQAMNDLIESKINNRPTKQRFKVNDLQEQIEERILKNKDDILNGSNDCNEAHLSFFNEFLESLNVSDYVKKSEYEALREASAQILDKREKDYVKKEDVTFTFEELCCLRQWFNCITDVNPDFLNEQLDQDLNKKINKLIG